jgi:hypothetical protein
MKIAAMTTYSKEEKMLYIRRHNKFLVENYKIKKNEGIIFD